MKLEQVALVIPGQVYTTQNRLAPNYSMRGSELGMFSSFGEVCG